LTGSEVNDDTLAALSQFTQLRSISLFNTSATGAGFKRLTKCTQLRQVTIIGALVNDEGIARLGRLQSLTHVQFGKGLQPRRHDQDGHPVAAAHAPLTDAALAGLAPLENLGFLETDNTQISNLGLDSLRSLTNLRSLQFFRTPDVTDSGLAALRESLPNCAMASHDQATPADPHFTAVLVISAGPEGTDSPSRHLEIGRLPDNSYLRQGTLRSGPDSALLSVTWEFNGHQNGADVYDIQWTLVDHGATVNAEQTQVGFNGDRVVLLDDERSILLESKAKKLASE
jgi:hypothetical protein